MKKILFLDSVHNILEERLEELGYSCVHNYTSRKGEVEEFVGDYFGVVIRSRFPLDRAFFEAATNLKFVARSGAGLENIDLDTAAEKGVEVFNSPEGNCDAVAEHALGMLLMLFNQLKKGDAEVRLGRWDREGNRGLELAEKTVGIIGYGVMGKAFAQRLTGFSCKVMAHDKYLEGFGNELVTEASLDQLYEQADIVSIHLPLSAETQHYVDEAFLQKFSKPIYLINTARGNNVSLEALVSGLKTGQVAGTCLDVLEYESKSFEMVDAASLPDTFRYLREAQNVIFSPHVAGWTEESYVKLAEKLADKIVMAFH